MQKGSPRTEADGFHEAWRMQSDCLRLVQDLRISRRKFNRDFEEDEMIWNDMKYFLLISFNNSWAPGWWVERNRLWWKPFKALYLSGQGNSLSLQRSWSQELDVLEPKLPEQIYKSHLEAGKEASWSFFASGKAIYCSLRLCQTEFGILLRQCLRERWLLQGWAYDHCRLEVGLQEQGKDFCVLKYLYGTLFGRTWREQRPATAHSSWLMSSLSFKTCQGWRPTGGSPPGPVPGPAAETLGHLGLKLSAWLQQVHNAVQGERTWAEACDSKERP